MEIGLISINTNSDSLNFACPLHTYAFHQFLRHNGIKSTVIDYWPAHLGDFDIRHPLYHYQKHPANNPKKQQLHLKRWQELFEAREVRMDKFTRFIEKCYEPIMTKRRYTTEQLDIEDPGFDCYICVGDVIWKNFPKHGLDKGFLLGSATMEGKRKIAYAVSRGPSTYPPKMKDQFLGLIQDFDHIAVRESSFRDYIKQAAGLDVAHVVDPVFLQNRRFYDKMAVPPKRGRPFVLIYIVMEQNTAIVRQAVEFAQSHGLDVVELSEDPEHARIPEGTHHDVIYDIGVEEWLGYLREADHIFTNSFHGCCFSMIFQKQFFAGQRNGDKIDSLLEMFGLTGRRIGADVDGAELRMPDIDYARVHRQIAQRVRGSKRNILTAIRRVRTGVARKSRIVKKQRAVRALPSWLRSLIWLMRRVRKLTRRVLRPIKRIFPAPGEAKSLKYTVSYDGNGAVGQMPDTTVYFAVPTQLQPNQFVHAAPNTKFAGWYAQRLDRKWLYDNGSSFRWYIAGSQPSGWVKHLYPNRVVVSKSSQVNNDIVTMYAQWAPRKYTILYDGNGGSGEMPQTTVYYGVPTILRRNEFVSASPSSSFAGWHAQRASDGKWLYDDGSTNAWHIEGAQPSGWVKHLYPDTVSVSKSTTVNNDTVTMYAQWE